MILRTCAYARAGLVGNPSDGYYGKTISIILKNFRAEIVLYESPEIVIEPNERDLSHFPSLAALVDDVHRHGYYGGVRLIKAAIKKFADYCRDRDIVLAPRCFTIRYHSDIPRLVGLAGSSAIVTATFRALMQFYDVDIARPVLATFILAAEHEELGITAGLQDRVIQVYEGAVYMDFDRALMDRDGAGRYEPLDPAALPPLYVAFDPNRSEASDRVHNRMRALFDKGDTLIVSTIGRIAELAEAVRDLIAQGRGAEIGPLLDENYDLRTRIVPISAENATMIECARAAGASAKFSGSGGAIIGTYRDEAMYRKLKADLSAIGCSVIRPMVS